VVKFYVRVTRPRPDFRLVLAFVWGDDVDTDTDGDSRPADSREWTELYAQNRGRKDEVFDVLPEHVEPLVLRVQSEHEWLAASVAHLLAEITGGGVSDQAAGPFVSAESVLARVGAFDVPAAWERFRNSRYQSTP
jgi:hypothetical protein